MSAQIEADIRFTRNGVADAADELVSRGCELGVVKPGDQVLLNVPLVAQEEDAHIAPLEKVY